MARVGQHDIPMDGYMDISCNSMQKIILRKFAFFELFVVEVGHDCSTYRSSIFQAYRIGIFPLWFYSATYCYRIHKMQLIFTLHISAPGQKTAHIWRHQFVYKWKSQNGMKFRRYEFWSSDLMLQKDNCRLTSIVQRPSDCSRASEWAFTKSIG